MATFEEASQGNAAAGAKVFKTKCSICHGFEKGGSSWLGPNLHGLFGRQAGTLEGYSYSAAMKAKGAEALVWKEDTIYEYICNPRAYVPGSKKVFAGVKKPQDRADLIAYLNEATA